MTNDALAALRVKAQGTVAYYKRRSDGRADDGLNASLTILALLDEVARITAERDDALLCAEQLRAEVDRLTCERDAARAEVERWRGLCEKLVEVAEHFRIWRVRLASEDEALLTEAGRALKENRR